MAVSSSTGATEDIIIIINTQLLLLLLLLLLLFFFLLLLRCGVSFGKKKQNTHLHKTFLQSKPSSIPAATTEQQEREAFLCCNPSDTAIPATTPSLLCVYVSLSLSLRARESAATAATSVAMTVASDGELHMGERERKGQNRLATR
jgi:hypothetical protein